MVQAQAGGAIEAPHTFALTPAVFASPVTASAGPAEVKSGFRWTAYLTGTTTMRGPALAQGAARVAPSRA